MEAVRNLRLTPPPKQDRDAWPDATNDGLSERSPLSASVYRESRKGAKWARFSPDEAGAASGCPLTGGKAREYSAAAQASLANHAATHMELLSGPARADAEPA